MRTTHNASPWGRGKASYVAREKKEMKSCQSFVGAHQKVSNMHNKFGSPDKKREAKKVEFGREREKKAFNLIYA